jgi:ATP-dependent RNA helicase SUPV3L1/SUV3
MEGIARGVAFQVAEHLGVLDRALVAKELRDLSQEARGALRKLGLRFGAYHVYTPALLKPAPRALAAQLWSLKHAGPETRGLDEIAHLSSSGRTSFAADPAVPKALYRAAGFRAAGPRAIRVDILERLADLIRPAIAWKPGLTADEPPAGAHAGDGFTVTVAMTSLVGCAGEDFAGVLKALGYRMEQRPALPPRPPAAATEPVVAAGPQAAETDGDMPEPTEPEPTEAEEAAAGAPDAGEVAGDETIARAEAAEAGSLAAPDDAAPDAGPAPAADGAATAGTPEEPPASVPAEEAGVGAEADTAPEASEPAPVVMVEVWRPGRPEGQSRDHRREAGQQRGRWRGKPGEAPGTPGEGRPRPERRQGGQGQPARADGERPAAGDGERRHDRPRFDRPRQDRPRDRDRQNREGSRGPRPEGGGQEGRGHAGRGQEGRGPQGKGGQRFEQPRRPERQADPDSPFAALAALKAQLESQGRK